jgi:molecular chaperone DnaJ
MNAGNPKKEDYYQILGVVRSADSADIDAAYRALARRFHPDLSPSTPQSLARLKLINEAYSILSDSQKRRDYDRRRPVLGMGPVGSSSNETTAASDLQIELPVAPEEAVYGGPCELTLTTWARCGHCSGPGTRQAAECTKCEGRGKVRQQRAFSVYLPPRMQTGTILRVPSQGGESPWGDRDLVLRIKVRPCW